MDIIIPASFIQIQLLAPRHYLRGVVLADRQVQEVVVIRYDQALFVGQVEHADETERRRNVGHHLLRIHRLQLVDDVAELQRLVGCPND